MNTDPTIDDVPKRARLHAPRASGIMWSVRDTRPWYYALGSRGIFKDYNDALIAAHIAVGDNQARWDCLRIVGHRESLGIGCADYIRDFDEGGNAYIPKDATDEVLGRLETLAIIALFNPESWRR